LFSSLFENTDEFLFWLVKCTNIKKICDKIRISWKGVKMKRWQIIFGLVLITAGAVSLVEVLFDVDLSPFIWPLILIGLGTWLILRPRLVEPGVQVEFQLFGDIEKTGIWEAKDHEIWSFVGSPQLDFSNALFSQGESTIRLFGFVSEVAIILPEDVGLNLESTAFLTDYQGLDRKEERFFSSIKHQSPQFSDMEKRVNIQVAAFVTEIRIKRTAV